MVVPIVDGAGFVLGAPLWKEMMDVNSSSVLLHLLCQINTLSEGKFRRNSAASISFDAC